MRTFTFQENELYELNRYSFIPLGQEVYDVEQLKEKLQKQFTPVDSIWGTLGWANDKPFTLTGKVDFSRRGNPKSLGATGEIVRELKSFNPLIDNQDPLIERCIDLSKVNFEFPDHCNLDEIPKLRLTVFLEPNEGALVYYQHNLKSDKHDQGATWIAIPIPAFGGTVPERLVLMVEVSVS
ncbi:MAG: hypothetical protein RBR89_06500 [Candidatus Bipolaricaulis sp.]|nr:hypothetical protein [Candidatus Bipolaricaulis sp.]